MGAVGLGGWSLTQDVLLVQAPSEEEQLQGDAHGEVEAPRVLDQLPQEPAAVEQVKQKKTKLQKEPKPARQPVAGASQSKAKELKAEKQSRHQPEPLAVSSGSEESKECGNDSSEEGGDNSGDSDLSEGEKAVRRRWRLMRGLEAPSDGSSDETSSEDWSDEEQLTVVPQCSTYM
jgi:hypothetical protein